MANVWKLVNLYCRRRLRDGWGEPRPSWGGLLPGRWAPSGEQESYPERPILFRKRVLR
jgi:hypothetical protein